MTQVSLQTVLPGLWCQQNTHLIGVIGSWNSSGWMARRALGEGPRGGGMPAPAGTAPTCVAGLWVLRW